MMLVLFIRSMKDIALRVLSKQKEEKKKRTKKDDEEEVGPRKEEKRKTMKAEKKYIKIKMGKFSLIKINDVK